MRIVCAVVFVLATATAGVAQDLPAGPETTATVASTERGIARSAADKKFWLLGSALNAAMLLDTKSTFDVTRTCSDCYEANPFVRPFVRRGAATTYIAGEIFDAGVVTLAAGMRGSERRWMRRTWWVIPVALITGHAIAYRHNVKLVQ